MNGLNFYRNYRLNYLEDRQLISGSHNFWIRVWILFLLALLVSVPFVFESYLVYTLNLAAISVIGALGLNLLTGNTGQISLAHASFLALGALHHRLYGKVGDSLHSGHPNLWCLWRQWLDVSSHCHRCALRAYT